MDQRGGLCHLVAAEGLPSLHSEAPCQSVFIMKTCVKEFMLQDCHTVIQFNQQNKVWVEIRSRTWSKSCQRLKGWMSRLPQTQTYPCGIFPTSQLCISTTFQVAKHSKIHRLGAQFNQPGCDHQKVQQCPGRSSPSVWRKPAWGDQNLIQETQPVSPPIRFLPLTHWETFKLYPWHDKEGNPRTQIKCCSWILMH